jgi:polysaccharide chain length determinant protein (PEP-CTERM system associated)
MENLTAQLISTLKGIWKYRWQTISISWFIAIVGWVIVFNIPDVYQSSARIYIDTQSVLRPLMSGMVMTPNLEQQITIMSHTLISRPNIERVMRMVDMDIKSMSDTDREQIIKNLFDKIKIESTARENLFIISYNDKNPKMAKDVVQSLLTIFVDNTSGNKSKDSNSVIRFLDEQIKNYEEKLSKAETALKDFQLKNINSMPKQGTDVAGKLSAASDRLDQTLLDLKEAEQTLEMQKKRLANTEPLDERMAALNKTLETLRLTDTELHPDVISIKRQIANLHKFQQSSGSEDGGNIDRKFNPLLQQLNSEITASEEKIANLKIRVREYTERVNQLKALNEIVPENEANLTQLNRDYLVNKSNYEKLIERRDSAKLSGNMDESTELMTFKIIDPPTFPQIPSAPNRIQLYTITLIIALLSGFGFSLLMSQLLPTFYSQSNLQEISKFPVLGKVSNVWIERDMHKFKLDIYKFSFLLLILILLYGMVVLRTALKIGLI